VFMAVAALGQCDVFGAQGSQGYHTVPCVTFWEAGNQVYDLLVKEDVTLQRLHQ
jgi:hypothetical protein